MYPQPYEIDQVSNAIIAISIPEYTREQQEFLNKFLISYAKEYNEAQMKKVFNNQIQILDSLKIISDFSNQYQDETEVFEEFKEELEDFLVNLNQQDTGISI